LLICDGTGPPPGSSTVAWDGMENRISINRSFFITNPQKEKKEKKAARVES
jgi:hypothetical protein